MIVLAHAVAGGNRKHHRVSGDRHELVLDYRGQAAQRNRLTVPVDGLAGVVEGLNAESVEQHVPSVGIQVEPQRLVVMLQVAVQVLDQLALQIGVLFSGVPLLFVVLRNVEIRTIQEIVVDAAAEEHAVVVRRGVRDRQVVNVEGHVFLQILGSRTC